MMIVFKTSSRTHHFISWDCVKGMEDMYFESVDELKRTLRKVLTK